MMHCKHFISMTTPLVAASTPAPAQTPFTGMAFGRVVDVDHPSKAV